MDRIKIGNFIYLFIFFKFLQEKMISNKSILFKNFNYFYNYYHYYRRAIKYSTLQSHYILTIYFIFSIILFF